MIKANLTLAESEIIKQVCNLQIQSLIRSSFENTVLFQLIEVGVDESEDEIKKVISSFIKTFSELRNNPEDLLTLEDTHRQLIIHHLFNWDDEDFKYTNDPRPRLYQILFRANDFKFNLQLNLN